MAKNAYFEEKRQSETLCLMDKIRPTEARNTVLSANDFHPKGEILCPDGMA